MDTNKEILEHSKIKLELYRLYLERYLSVLIAAPQVKKINVVDILAGRGISKNNEKGSAVIAAEAIHSVLYNNASSLDDFMHKHILFQEKDSYIQQLFDLI